ncbi:MAG TPA: hypothetical protein VJB14_15820 [Planctomycetota bacterium]|nr:hypothetical protein [Planctomycetota bacterium]
MRHLWAGAALVSLALRGPLAADEEQVRWVKWEEARAKSSAGGKPVLVFCMTDLIVDGPPVKGLDRAWASECVRTYKDDFHFVKCADLKLAKAVKATSKCELIFLDPDGVELLRVVVRSAEEIAAALKECLTRYAGKPIAWTPNSPPSQESAPSGKPMTVVLFGDDSEGVAAAIRSLEDRRVAGVHEKCLFVRIQYRKDSAETREWNVQGTPTLLLLDSIKDFGPKSVLERSWGRKTPREMKAFLIKGLVAIEKGRR